MALCFCSTRNRNLWLLAALIVASLGAGCSGISASKSISPLDFLLPGLGNATPPGAPALPPNGTVVAQTSILSPTQHSGH